jgi:hypothetical protein
MTVRDTQRAIEPGSTESGDRATLEQGLSEVLAQGGGGAAPQPPAAGGVGIPSDPVAGLLNGDVSGDQLPTTDGLSVGPGAGGAQDGTPVLEGARADGLRDLAENSSVPGIRQAARNELRRMARRLV